MYAIKTSKGYFASHGNNFVVSASPELSEKFGSEKQAREKALKFIRNVTRKEGNEWRVIDFFRPVEKRDIGAVRV